jgi:hypothetical protein
MRWKRGGMRKHLSKTSSDVRSHRAPAQEWENYAAT